MSRRQWVWLGRLIGGTAVGLVLQQLWWEPYTLTGMIVPFLAGLACGSWWVLFLTPVPAMVAGDVRWELTCFDCRQTGETAAALQAIIGTPIDLLAYAVAGVVGVLAGKGIARLIRRVRRDTTPEPPKQQRRPAWMSYGIGIGSWLALHVALLVVLIPVRTTVIARQVEAAERRPWDVAVAGRPWDGKARGTNGWSRGQVERFSEYGLFWLGESYGGYNLTRVFATGKGRGQVTFVYGACPVEKSWRSCTGTFSVTLYPICAFPPERAYGPEPAVTVRGNGRLVRMHPFTFNLITGQTTIVVSLYTPTRADADAAVQALRGIGATSAIGPGDPLPAPDLSRC